MSALEDVLSQIGACDNIPLYPKRYRLVLQAVALAAEQGLMAGFRLDPAEPEWPVAYIELPTGQVSWHMPQHPKAWDGHTAEEKYRRVTHYVESKS